MKRNALPARPDRSRHARLALRDVRWVACLIVVLGFAAGKPAMTVENDTVEAMRTDACPDGICRGLGHAFYLPAVNGFDPPDVGNDFFLDTRLGSCATLSPPTERATRQFQSAENMRELTVKTVASFELDARYSTARLTARASVSAMTGADSTTTERMTSTHLDITTPTRNVDFKVRGRDCFAKSNVDPEDVKQFEALPPISPERAGQQSEWDPYQLYLERLGSHIMIRQQLGSRFQRWESSSATTTDLLNVLKAKACAAVEGKETAKKGWSVDSCADYSREQREKASSTHSESRQIAMGGTEATRVAITQEVTKESIDAFIASGSQGDQPIRFGFKPVWELWMQIYSPLCTTKGSKDCENLQRAYNLKTAYEGLLAIGCPREEDGNGSVYQTVAPTGDPNTQGMVTYGCFAERTGCRSNLDCRIGGVFGACYCHGASCLDQGARVVGTDQFRTRVRATQEGGYREGVNNSCRLRGGIKNTCSCDTSWQGGLRRRDLFLPR
ncbi:hypothetical protein [Tahibacter amnicola]|uniref:MAC/Perforin domain-containing protein n=1 Tax=Tahibacter amnicola TaxID=2976241 RepID=A0ABY6B7C8_9GAMM|nr:hypothetical protein [Tahibacter amnicola]UXI65899.1 hypothetical protein N4264_14145 [Tahibacter amnicola]